MWIHAHRRRRNVGAAGDPPGRPYALTDKVPLFHPVVAARFPNNLFAQLTSDDSTTVSYPQRGQQVFAQFFFRKHPAQRVLAVMSNSNPHSGQVIRSIQAP
jgi:hypothetical protein